MNIQDVLDIINVINDEMYEATQDDEVPLLTVMSNTNGIAVEYLNTLIWCDVDDAREYDEDDEYEPLDSYLRREMNAIINKLKKLNL